MARYEHLPIYKQALDVAVHCEKVVAGFSRYHKYALGTELRNASRAVLSQIAYAPFVSNINLSADLILMRCYCLRWVCFMSGLMGRVSLWLNALG